MTSFLPKTRDEFVTWCYNDPAFFLESSTLISSRGRGEIPFVFNDVQIRHHKAIYRYPRPHFAICAVHDGIEVKTRQFGGSTWEIGDGYHSFAFRKSYVFKVVTYADGTAAKLKKMANLFYTSSRDSFEEFGIDPEKHLPYVRALENQHEMYCNKSGSLIEFTSAGSKGEGRALTVNRLYFTEYPEYDHPEDVLSGMIGSFVQDGSARTFKDGTGSGIGNAFYREYQAAKRGEGAETPFFYGRDDFKYPAGFLDKQKKRLGPRRFKREYPATDEEAFLKQENSRFETEQIEAAGKVNGKPAEYLCDIIGEKKCSMRIHSHGVDTCEGIPSGDYATISTFDLKLNHETCEPYHKQSTPRQLAHAIRARVERYPGVVTVERNNHGHAVIQKCVDLKLREGEFAGQPLSNFLYVHEQIDSDKVRKRRHDVARKSYRYGYPQTSDNKTLMETEMEIVLDDGKIVIVSENARQELREYSRRDDGSFGAPKTSRDGDHKFYDDEAISAMLSQVGRRQAMRLVITRKRSGFAGVGSQGAYDAT